MDTMPQLGVGTFRLEGDTARQSVLNALDIGYQHIDTAQIYNNEEEVGHAIQTSAKDRDSLFVTTKVWYENLNKGKFIPSVHESLAKLTLDHVDLLLIHWPSPDENVPMEEYLGCLAQAKQEGLTRHIGVSNFTRAQLDKAVEVLGKGQILTNQIELHPFLQNRQVAEKCAEHGINVTAYMPLAVGKVMKDPTLKNIAEKHDVSPAQVALAWLAAKNYHVIFSSTKKDHLKSNFDFDKIKLSDEDKELIDNLDKGERIADPGFAPQWD